MPSHICGIYEDANDPPLTAHAALAFASYPLQSA